MIYPKKFIAEVKRLFPDNNEVHEGLEAGGTLIGRLLEDTGDSEIGPNTVVKMLNNGKLDELRAMAEKIISCRELSAEWKKLYDEQRQ